MPKKVPPLRNRRHELGTRRSEGHTNQKENPAGAERRCRSWCRASWPRQGSSCAPGDPCGAARASRPRPVTEPARPALPLAGRFAALGSSQRLRPSYTVSPAGQRHFIASRWSARRLTELCGTMSALARVSSASHWCRNRSRTNISLGRALWGRTSLVRKIGQANATRNEICAKR